MALGAECKRRGCSVGTAQEDHHRHHAVSAVHFRQVETLVRQPVQRERPPVRLLLQQDTTASRRPSAHSTNRGTSSSRKRPARLQLLVPTLGRGSPRCRALVPPEAREPKRLARVPGHTPGRRSPAGSVWIFDDKVLEVVVVAHVRHVRARADALGDGIPRCLSELLRSAQALSQVWRLASNL